MMKKHMQNGMFSSYMMQPLFITPKGIINRAWTYCDLLNAGSRPTTFMLTQVDS